MYSFAASETWWERKAKETSRGIGIDFISKQLVENLRRNMFSTDLVSGTSSGETSGHGSPQLSSRFRTFADLSTDDNQGFNGRELRGNGRRDEDFTGPTNGFGRAEEVPTSKRRAIVSTPCGTNTAAYPSNLTSFGRGRPSVAVDPFCSLCKNNGEAVNWYMSHTLKDSRGKVSCPVLRNYHCPKCNNRGGDMAHTLRYCPLNEAPSSTPLAKVLRTERTSSGRRRTAIASCASVRTQLKC